MIEIARAKNAVPLPLIRPGVHLPPPEHCNNFTSMQLTGTGANTHDSICMCDEFHLSSLLSTQPGHDLIES
jgi:hypothetical protein